MFTYPFEYLVPATIGANRRKGRKMLKIVRPVDYAREVKDTAALKNALLDFVGHKQVQALIGLAVSESLSGAVPGVVLAIPSGNHLYRVTVFREAAASIASTAPHSTVDKGTSEEPEPPKQD